MMRSLKKVVVRLNMVWLKTSRRHRSAKPSYVSVLTLKVLKGAGCNLVEHCSTNGACTHCIIQASCIQGNAAQPCAVRN